METNRLTASSPQLRGEFSVLLYRFAPTTDSLDRRGYLLLLINAFITNFVTNAGFNLNFDNEVKYF